MNNFLTGTGVAMVTPFNEDGSIDFGGLTALIEYCIAGKVEYFVVLGTTAEVVTLTSEEKKAVIAHVININAKRLPLVIGIGGNNTQQVITEILETPLDDFEAILTVVPYYNKPSQEGIYQHYKAIASQAPLPIIIYNVPGRTGVNMSAETTLRLAEVSNICGVKEATSDITQILKILAGKPSGFSVISGDDTLALPLVTAGGDGVITVVGQGFPLEFSEMIRLGLAGKNKEAYAIHSFLIPPTEYAFEEGNPAGIKSILKHKGVCDAYVRLPIVPASKALDTKVAAFVSKN